MASRSLVSAVLEGCAGVVPAGLRASRGAERDLSVEFDPVRYLRRMWGYGSNDGRGEYLSGTAATLAEALAAMCQLAAERPERYVHVDCLSHSLVARWQGGRIGFVVIPVFAIDGDYDPPDEADAYSPDEVLALDAADELLLPAEEHCDSCQQPMKGYLANRTSLRGNYFACLTCQRWTEMEPKVIRSGPRSRLSPLSE